MSARLILVVTTTLAILAGVAAWAFVQRDHHATIHVRMAQGHSFQVGSPVRYLGVDVGTISRIDFIENGRRDPLVALELRITERDVPIRVADSVEVTGMGADRALSIFPGPPDAPRLTSDDTLVVVSPGSDETRHIIDALTNDLMRQEEAAKHKPPPARRRPPG